jgi:Ca2+-binding RTX toxin-like protein
MHTDATLEALGVPPGLLIGGSSGNDRVKVVNDNGLIDLLFGGISRGTFSLVPTDVVSAHLGNGDDRLECNADLLNPVLAEGGNGNDTIGGGGGRDFLRGGLGIDRFLRSAGKDRLIT